MLTGFTVFLSLLLFNSFSAITSADQTAPAIKSSKYSASSYHAEYTWKGLHLRETPWVDQGWEGEKASLRYTQKKKKKKILIELCLAS